MQVRALSLFVELARSDSIRQVAQRLKLTSTAVSRQLDHLEYHFRTRLIDRSATGIKLTAAGQLLLARAQSIIEDVRTTEALIDDLRCLHHGEVRVHAGGAMVGGLLAPVLSALHRLHPGLRFAIEVTSATEVFSAVNQGVADLGVTIFPADCSKVMIRRTLKIDHAVIVAPTHLIAGLDAVPMHVLAGQALAIPNVDFGLRQDLDRLARAASVRLDPVFVTSSIETQKELAIQGDAVLVLPPLCCRRELETGLLKAIPLAASNPVATSLVLCTGLNRALPFAAEALRDGIDRYMTANL